MEILKKLCKILNRKSVDVLFFEDGSFSIYKPIKTSLRDETISVFSSETELALWIEKKSQHRFPNSNGRWVAHLENGYRVGLDIDFKNDGTISIFPIRNWLNMETALIQDLSPFEIIGKTKYFTKNE